MSNEQFYDDEIAPALAEIAKKCLEKGLSMVAVVQYGEQAEQRGATYVTGGNSSLPMIMLRYCDQTAPNIDCYMIGMMKYCAKHSIDTSSSIFMRNSIAAHAKEAT